MARLFKIETDAGWPPILYLVFLGFFFIQPVMRHAGWKEWALTVGAVVVFLLLYLPLWYKRSPRFLWCAAGITLLGVVAAPYNPGALGFFIYAVSSLGFLAKPELAVRLLVVVLSIAAAECWLIHADAWSWVLALLYSAVIGVANIHYGTRRRANKKLQLAQAEVERLAKVAERERIARDMHDVLGHTLSVIVLKSELASRLIDRDPARARKEMVEVEETARAALGEVRAAIRGYRAESVKGEISRACATLETAGVHVECEVECESEKLTLTPAQETVLALVIREAVTNVVRHAQAQWCRLSLHRQGHSCHLEIQDNGRGGPSEEGNGLRGMRERIEALEGTLVRESSPGTRLTITLPLSS